MLTAFWGCFLLLGLFHADYYVIRTKTPHRRLATMILINISINEITSVSLSLPEHHQTHQPSLSCWPVRTKWRPRICSKGIACTHLSTIIFVSSKSFLPSRATKCNASCTRSISPLGHPKFVCPSPGAIPHSQRRLSSMESASKSPLTSPRPSDT